MTTHEPTTLGVAILSLLDERDMHPYEMIQTLRSRGEDQWVKVTTGSLYHQVERLVSAGYAEVSGTQQDGNRPPRTTYRLTATGRTVLTTWVSDHLTVVENPYLAFSLALAEIATLPADDALRRLAQRGEALDEEIATTQRQLDLALTDGAKRAWLLAHEHRLTLMTSERDYVASLIDTITTKELEWPSQQ